ncbi:MAG TPA: DinB family protein [Candidatus Dormibacteraeota bacterium]|nr:DinB family protein [Candidatus Dormibacteraeota bacterium]
MAEFDAGEVGKTFRELFHLMHDRFREQVRDLDHGTLNWRPLPKANSIAVLVAHSLGSERELIRAVRSLPSERDRESEFKVEAEAAELMELLDRADRELDEHLGGLTQQDLIEDRPRKDHEPHTGLYWLLSNYGHEREHLAQIELTKQLYDSRT